VNEKPLTRIRRYGTHRLDAVRDAEKQICAVCVNLRIQKIKIGQRDAVCYADRPAVVLRLDLKRNMSGNSIMSAQLT
jgi:hypothetical protein